MAKVIVVIDTETQDCQATIDGMPLEFDAIGLSKFYYSDDDGNDKSHLSFWYEQTIKNDRTGMMENHRYMVMSPPDSESANQVARIEEVAGIEIPVVVTPTEQSVSRELSSFLKNRKKRRNRKWSY